MRKSNQHAYRQAYNAQAVVDAGGSRLIANARISQCAGDRNELVADIAAMPAPPEASGIEALVSTAASSSRLQLQALTRAEPGDVKHPGGACRDRARAATLRDAAEPANGLYREETDANSAQQQNRTRSMNQSPTDR